jgi:hypothetical protein
MKTRKLVSYKNGLYQIDPIVNLCNFEGQSSNLNRQVQIFTSLNLTLLNCSQVYYLSATASPRKKDNERLGKKNLEKKIVSGKNGFKIGRKNS